MATETGKTEVVETPQPKAEEKPPSLSERIEKSVTEQWDSAPKEGAAEQAAEGAAAPPAGSEQVEGEPKPEEVPEKIEVTPEQLRDPKFWGALDKSGWERMERDYPVATMHVKSGQAAATKIVNEARRTTQQPPAEVAADKPTEVSPELQDAIRRANSLDELESAKGLQDIIKLTLKDALPEFGFNPEAAKAAAVAQTAYATVVAELPEIANLDPKVLDAAVEGNPALLSMLARADGLPDNVRVGITADVMKIAAANVMASQKADATARSAADAKKTEKTKETQRKVNSNASIPSNVVVESPSGGAPKGKETHEQYVNRLYAEAAAKEQTAAR